MEEPPKVTVLPARPQSERVRRYFSEHGQETWKNRLSFLLDTFPQVEDGRIQHLLYGGAAIKLLYPQRQDPVDIDAVTRDEQMATEFPPQLVSPPIDVHSIEDWLQYHQLPLSPDLIEFIFRQYRAVNFGGREILVMNPELLAWSKMNVLGGRVRRPKDLEDLRLLEVSPKNVEALSFAFKGFKKVT